MVTQGKRVLVVEDDANIRRLIELKLKAGGYSVSCASDGDQGLVLLTGEKPDALITDRHLPGMDGLRLAEAANAMKGARPFLTILLTGSSDHTHVTWAERLRDTRVLGKPFSPVQLLGLLDQYFGVKR